MRSFAAAGRVLGELEEKLMEVFWRSEDELSVREAWKKLPRRPALAYTTVMTTCDRLFKKGLLWRRKEGLAFVYRPALTREAYHQRIVEETLGTLFAHGAEPALAAFVDAAATLDEDNLKRLERLIAARRKGRR